MKVLSFMICHLMVLEGCSTANIADTEEAEKQALIETIAKALKEKYVSPDLGNEVACIIKYKMAKGRYSRFSMSQSLASQLEKDLFSITQDKHLHIVFTGADDKGDLALKDSRNMEKTNDSFGFNKTKRISGNIGYIKIDRMAGEREATRIAASSIQQITPSKAIIFDLRDNRGGAAGMVVLLSSYLFDKPIHLYSMYNRLENETKDVWTFTDLPGQKLGEERPVYILTSSRTFSAAEGFAYSLKHHHRAIIVGERTGGGAHPMIWIELPSGFMLCIPFARIIHPITETDWEGVGVVPHHSVSAENALKTAIDLINRSK